MNARQRRTAARAESRVLRAEVAEVRASAEERFPWLRAEAEAAGPHAAGQAECVRCGRCWVAVWPVGAVEPLHLECPGCGAQVPTPKVEGR